jgi:hypothetical protein
VLDTTVPRELPDAIQAWDPEDFRMERLAQKHLRVLEDFFGHGMFLQKDMVHHQLGGVPLAEAWDDSAFPCRNPSCSPGWLDRLMKRPRPMRFLAGVLNDPPRGLPLVEPLNEETAKDWLYGVSHFWQICDKCLSITTFSTSD